MEPTFELYYFMLIILSAKFFQLQRKFPDVTIGFQILWLEQTNFIGLIQAKYE